MKNKKIPKITGSWWISKLSGVYDITYSKDNSILSVSCTFHNDDPSLEFSLDFSINDAFVDSKYTFQISYCMIIVVYYYALYLRFRNYRKRRHEDWFEAVSKFLLFSFSFLGSIFNLISTISNVWIMWYFFFEHSSIFHGAMLIFIYSILLLEHILIICAGAIKIDAIDICEKYFYTFATAWSLFLIWIIAISGFLFNSFIMKVLVNPSHDIIFFFQVMIWLPRILQNVWYK